MNGPAIAAIICRELKTIELELAAYASDDQVWALPPGLPNSGGTLALHAAGNLQLTSNMGMVALIAANLYVIFFNGTWGPVMWVMLGEMFPNQIRGSALAVAADLALGALERRLQPPR